MIRFSEEEIAKIDYLKASKVYTSHNEFVRRAVRRQLEVDLAPREKKVLKIIGEDG